MIDLTGVSAATLAFAQARDLETGNIAVAGIYSAAPDPDIDGPPWETVAPIAISGAALGQAVRIEWRFTNTVGSTSLDSPSGGSQTREPWVRPH